MQIHAALHLIPIAIQHIQCLVFPEWFLRAKRGFGASGRYVVLFGLGRKPS